jgi:hypothetical protein
MGVVAKNIFSKEKHEKKHACTYFSRFSTVNVFTQSLSTISEKKMKEILHRDMACEKREGKCNPKEKNKLLRTRKKWGRN